MFNLSKLDKNTLRIALPLIASNITIPLVGFVDNMMMGQFGSAIYLGAIGLGSIIINYILFSFGFIKSITTGLVSQHSGSNDYKNLIISTYQVFFISMVISFVLLFFRQEIIYFSLQIMNASNEVKQSTKLYLDYRIWSIPAIFIRDILIGYYIGIQKIRLAMWISIVVNLINIIFDYYLVYFLNYGIEGIAIASLIAEYSIIFFVFFAFRNNEIFTSKMIQWTQIFRWSSIKDKVFINIDMFMRSLILMTVFLYFMSIGASYGNLTLAANTILINFFFIFSYGIDGFAHASEVLVGYAVGKKDKNLIKNSIRSTGKLSLILTFIYLLIFVLFDDNFINIISQNTDIINLASYFTYYLYMIFLFSFFAFWLDGVFIGAMRTKLLRNIMIFSGTSFFILETSFFGGNNDGLWLSFLIFFGLRSLFLSICLYKYLKDNKFLEN